MEELANDLKEIKSRPSQNNASTIYKVPETIRNVDKNAYDPQIISIGPYHQFSEKRLNSMDNYKLQAVNAMLRRNTDKSLEYYFEKLRPLVDRARSYYSEDIRKDEDEKDFVKMMLLDGCFILELLLNVNKKQETAEMSPICNNKWMVSLIGQDMLLLENQLPFFVIEELHKESSDSSSLVDLAIDFFDQYFFQRFLPRNKTKSPPKEVHHLLHLFHALLLPSETSTKVGVDDPKPTCPPRWIPSVTEIQRAGITFVKEEKETDSLLDIVFEELPKRIQIPRLSIYDSITNTLFRNLIAFEQCHPESGTYFKSYTVFMHCILKKEEDATTLKQKKIMEHWLGSDKEVVDLFNSMCKGIVINFEGNYLYDLFMKVAKSCEDYRSTWWRSLTHKDFTYLATVIKWEVAFLSLYLSLIQTFIAVNTYRHSSK